MEGVEQGEERENVTPCMTNVRSRKCLELSLKKGKPCGPLADTHNLPPKIHVTPRKVSDSPALALSQSPSPPSPTYSQFSMASVIPASVLPPKTPRYVLADPIRRTNLSSNTLLNPARLRTPVRRSPRKKKGAVVMEPPVKPETKLLPTIQAASFYATKPVIQTPEKIIPKVKVVRSLPALVRDRLSARGSLKRSGSGVKRKGGGGLRGVGHGIKKPKFKPVHPVLKISELPAMSIEIPKPQPHVPVDSPLVAHSSAPSTPTTFSNIRGTPTTRTPTAWTPTSTSGQLSLTRNTKVQFEVKGGQFVYRAKPKAGTTPRRSPRKHMSPLKADYFHGRRPRIHRSDRQKLFSPEKDFLSEESSEGEVEGGEGVPSPVKFHHSIQESSDDSAPDLSAILDTLSTGEKREEQDSSPRDSPQGSPLPGELMLSMSLPVVSSGDIEEASRVLAMETVEELALLPLSEELDMLPRTEEQALLPRSEVAMLPGTEKVALFTQSAVPMLPVSSAVSNILNDLSSEGESNDTSSQDDSLLDDGGPDHNIQQSKLFPVFYKDTSRNEKIPNRTVARQQGRIFLCNTLGKDQAFIDAGQKEIGATLCGTCGTVYTIGDPEDEAAHAAQHSGLLERLKLTGWKAERVVGQFPGGRVLCVRPGDDHRWWRKVEEALGVVDRDLGFSEVGIRRPDLSKAFLYVADRKIVGLLLAEQISQAYRILPPNEEDQSGKVYYCSEVPQPVLAGISRIWVLADYRRKKIASSLVDCMRSTFFADKYLNDLDFAFSDPTMHGIEFATKYVGNSEFLVYNR